MRKMITLLLLLSLAGNLWLGDRLLKDRRAALDAFSHSARTITWAMDIAFDGLTSEDPDGAEHWALRLQMIEIARNHADSASRWRPLLPEEQARIAHRFWVLMGRLTEASYIVGHLASGEEREAALLAMRNWGRIYEQANVPGAGQDPEAHWHSLNQSLERMLRDLSQRVVDCHTYPENAVRAENNPIFRYACD